MLTRLKNFIFISANDGHAILKDIFLVCLAALPFIFQPDSVDIFDLIGLWQDILQLWFDIKNMVLYESFTANSSTRAWLGRIQSNPCCKVK